MDLETFEISGATIDGTHVVLRGQLYRRTEAAGRTSWDGSGIAIDFPKPLRLASPAGFVEVVFEAKPRNVRGMAHVTFAATVDARGPRWPVTIEGTGDLEDA